MRIFININKLSQTTKRGISVYIYQILNELSKIDKKNRYILCAGSEISSCNYFLNNKNFNLKIIESKFGLAYWTYVKLPKEVIKSSPDIFFMPIQHAPFFLKKPKNIKVVTTIHDLAFLLFPKHFTLKDRVALNVNTKLAIKNSDKIIVPSNTTKNDLIEFYRADSKKISVIHHGNRIKDKDIDDKEQNKDSVLRKFNVSKSYILFIGVIQPRKNIVKLIEAFEIVRKRDKNISLVVCGEKGWLAGKTYKKAEESEYSNDIIFTGGVNDKELISLYKNAKMFVFPSLYEGFGIPVVEAMSLGLPVIIANNSSLHEIASGAGLFINEYDQNDIAEKISILLDNEELRKTLSGKSIKRANKFNWRNSAIKHLKVFNDLVY